jgi:(1->4)-alpha-D-glucan 1-alpha-D-glucosylmutase
MARTLTSTYRIQFTPDFGFREAIELIPYLDRLGVSHIYASPLLKPSEGSEHGYDVVDPTSLNPELGEESDFQELLEQLSSRGMGLILDIVPNHMAVNSANEWWQNVLEHGQRSHFAGYFDIDWARGDGKVVLPTLGDYFGAVLENGELQLGIDDRGLAVHYYENRFPIDPASYKQVLVEVRLAYRHEAGETESPIEAELDAIIDLSREIDSAAGNPDEIEQAASGLGRRVWNLYREGETIQRAFHTVFDAFNGTSGDPESFNQLERLLSNQQYRLAYWRRASEEINYRRFFDIGDLISLRIEDPEVFDAVHALILEYAGTHGIDGFRADHVDGLYDPQGYAERLHARLAEQSGNESDYVLLFEKILTGHEQLPPDWPISGTTGYEFAHRVNAVLADPAGFARIEQHYAQLTGLDQGFGAIVHRNKANVLDDLFIGQFRMLVEDFYRLAKNDRAYRDLSRVQLSSVLRQMMIELPVYRTYVSGDGVDQRDRQILQDTLDSVRGSLDGIEDQCWAFVHDVFLGTANDERCRAYRGWIRRWQQFTGPLMAKGLEDTALYVYTPLSSLNEVGGEPETLSPNELHAHNNHIAAHWPNSMLSTSTHDTKRSEDVRARIAVLSELSEEWIEHLTTWRAANAELREIVHGMPVPDANEEQLIYQTLLGAWPLDRAEFPTFRDRIKQYMIKAMREAKIYTHWIAIDEEHEQAVLRFIDRLVDEDPAGEFFREFVAFQTKISSYGAWNSLSQVALKGTSPGFPDFYQGNELWDFSLADPDNRRPVDFETRKRYVEQLIHGSAEDLPELVQQWRDGRIKALVTASILRSRRDRPEPFRSGDYLPLETTGAYADNVIAFARHLAEDWSITVVPRLSTNLVPPDQAPVGEDAWRDTRVMLPPEAPSTWVDIITGDRPVASDDREIRISDILRRVPVSVLRSP